MKFNKWTIGLAAAGVVSLASVAQAEETANTVLTALSSTTISGYVDTSVHWNIGTGNLNNPSYKFGGNYNKVESVPVDSNKADGFNLNVVQLSISKPMDESEWAAGYRADLWLGPDANVLQTSSQGGISIPGTGGVGSFGVGDFALRQAYVALRTPVGNGIDWKIGVFDGLLGYESVASPNNPNYTRSWGHSMEPQTHTGLAGTYRVNDNVSFSAGIANTYGPAINNRAFGDQDGDYSPDKAESFKTYMGSIALTAPDNWGFLAGSTLYAGIINGWAGDYNGTGTAANYYVGGTMATPVTGLRLGGAFDMLDVHDVSGETWAISGYASYQATEKLSLHGRAEYLRNRGDQDGIVFENGYGASSKVMTLTGTVQYDLWENVLTRAEIRWDHSLDGTHAFGGNLDPEVGGGSLKNAVLIAANIIYKF